MTLTSPNALRLTVLVSVIFLKSWSSRVVRIEGFKTNSCGSAWDSRRSADELVSDMADVNWWILSANDHRSITIRPGECSSLPLGLIHFTRPILVERGLISPWKWGGASSRWKHWSFSLRSILYSCNKSRKSGVVTELLKNNGSISYFKRWKASRRNKWKT